MVNIISSNEVLLSAQGRVVIPVALRKALDLKPGERLIARKEGESLVLERRETIEKRLWEMYSHVPKEVSLADELIAERRAEAQHEDEDKEP
ncbi:MAG TPA: AbrB/MazE/SpoVT family DNA-binding domain-containing protein [Candidatus Aenigmarchaeota archaeon]|nr:AbrB/MazE/SpoVT family DNA-binding domain-containing protein [Candidatus Aenigmarchaeota archaeon]